MFPRKLLVSLITILIVTLPIVAQNTTQLIDSLKIELSKASLDTVELNKILKKIDRSKTRNLKEVDSITQIILSKYKSIEYTDGIYRAMDLLATINYKKGNFKKALEYHKELLTVLEKNNSNPPIKANVYKFITGEYFNIGDFDTAIIYGEKSIIEFQNLNDSQNIARSLNLLGGIYWNKGNLKKASEKLYESLVIREKLKDSLGVANAYNNIGLIYDSQEKLPEAIEMYQKALELYKKINDDQGFGRACNNIAIVKKNQKKYSESLEMFMKSLEIDKKQKNIDEIGKTLNNIGLLHLELEDISKGIEFFNQAFEAFEQSGNKNGITAVYINLGRAYFLIHNYTKSNNYYQKSFRLAQSIGSNEWLRDSYEGLYKISKKQNNHEKALTFYEKFKSLDDSLRSLENLNKLDQLKIEFDTDQKEKEISLLSKDNELNSLKLKRQESYAHLLLTIIISVILILLLATIYVRRLGLDKEILLQKNKEITLQKEEILAQRDLLETANAELQQQQEELLTQTEQIEIQSRIILGINSRMLESIEYASLIQQTLLPSTSIFNKYFKNQFVLYKPKDIVSGDLYWAWENNDDIIFAIADCTGHGVAGAFVSVMAVSLLKDAVGVNRLYSPLEISNYLYREMRKNSYSELDSVIGIDFVICRYSRISKELTYCGNHMNFIAILNQNMQLIKVGKMLNPNSAPINFKQGSIQLKENDKLYFYTDGYTDQLSAVKRKKMGRSEFQKLLQEIEIHPHSLHHEMIDNFYNKWKGNFDQVDDVLVIGLEV
ncbi:MAG: tetratricopeptide repeat protein [Bacteroidales bacterium]